MNVLCPSCAAEYQIPALQRPRKLRCARCSAEWRAMPAADPPADADFDGSPSPGTAASASTAPSDPPAISLSPLAPLLAESRARGLVLRWAASREALLWPVLWVLSGLLLGVAAYAVWHWRVAIGHGWPPSLRLYRLLPGGS